VYQVRDRAMAREHAREGVARQRVARRLGCSRTAAYRPLALESPPRYERPAAGSLLDPFEGAVAAVLAEEVAARSSSSRLVFASWPADHPLRTRPCFPVKQRRTP